MYCFVGHLYGPGAVSLDIATVGGPFRANAVFSSSTFFHAWNTNNKNFFTQWFNEVALIYTKCFSH